MISKNANSCMTTEGCWACSKKILVWTVIGNAVLVVIKLAGGTFANSSGMIADGIQSIACVVTSILIMVSLSFSSRPNDVRFPYGYAKLEFIVALIAFSILIGFGVSITLSSILAILRRDFVQPDIVLALPVAVASVFLTYMIQRYNFCAGKRLDSSGLIANGCHAGADVLSSSAVILGIILSQMGADFAVCDRLAALIVGVVIVKDSLSHWASNVRNILDQVPEPGFALRIEKMILSAYPKYRPGSIKFKRVGKKFWVGISLRCPKTGTLQEVCVAMDDMKKSVIRNLPSIGEVDFFFEPA
ncbi:MAG: cation transporter [Candidatus Omnitrophica bacterium]|nr:cation transporter [Candidatus Omnitrophota bacterium]